MPRPALRRIPWVFKPGDTTDRGDRIHTRFVIGLTASRGDQWTATTAAALAGLEYINYYHRQLQHFDHAPDFKKLITGQGFRRSQLARDLRAWRRMKG